MFWIKLGGAGLVALSGWLGGAVSCEHAIAHRVSLEQTIALLKILEEEILFHRANLNLLYLRFAQENMFPSLRMLNDSQSGQVNRGEHACFQTMSPPACFTTEEAHAFSECFSRLGRTGALQECEQLTRYQKQFERFYKDARKVECDVLAINRKIGLALGSMVALVLL